MIIYFESFIVQDSSIYILFIIKNKEPQRSTKTSSAADVDNDGLERYVRYENVISIYRSIKPLHKLKVYIDVIFSASGVR